MRKWIVIGAGLATGLGLTAANPAAAFTFSDSTTLTCVVKGEKVKEYVAPPDEAVVKGRVGRTIFDGKEWVIVWNPERQAVLPPVVRDFLFFHECGHAQVPTQDEVAANCAGLQSMRAAGRAGLGVEAQLASYFGADTVYWKETLACANKAPAK